VRFGARWAKHYHLILILTGISMGLLYTFLNYDSALQLLFLLSVPLLAMDIQKVLVNTVPIELNAELKRLSLATLLFSFSFGVGLVL
jgi:1,4-dihydroxy-2-naphthoate octaprenyltransferase